MVQKSVFACQPFSTGGGQKNHKSLALIIPSQIVREFSLSNETILALKIDADSKKITIEIMRAETELA